MSDAPSTLAGPLLAAFCNGERVEPTIKRNWTTIKHWLLRVGKVDELRRLPLTENERSRYLDGMFKSIVGRLRKTRVIDAIASDSPEAAAHGESRYRQGYTAPMIVQESRLLQVCIFETIQRNLSRVDFSLVLPDVMLIADEVDSQLTQSIDSYLKAQRQGGKSLT